MVANCFNKLELTDKPVNGYSVEKLPKTEEGALGVRIKYTDVFHFLLTKNVFDPTNYLIELTKQYFEKNGDDEKLYGFIARGLRSLASFLREPDFAEILLNNLAVYDKNTSVDLCPFEDAGNHTDILLTYKNVQYRIWLFQFSERGLPHDIERVSGKRGELPSGIHLLCPLHTQQATHFDKFSNRISRLKGRISKYKEKLLGCSDRAIAGKKKLSAQITTCEYELKTIQKEIDVVSKSMSEELDIIEGWYFYSIPHIKRISKLIQTPPKPYQYEEVVKIMLAPETFLSNVRFLEKT